jgi:hypothetical protein
MYDNVFKDNWLYPTVEDGNLYPKSEYSIRLKLALAWRFNEYTENRIKQEHKTWTDTLLRSNFLESTYNLGKSCGNNIFVSLSGGADSQATCLALQQAGIPFTAAILVFEHDLNANDTDVAFEFCEKNNIDYITVNIDLMRFLTRDLKSYIEKYQCISPQITPQFWFYEKLINEHDATSIIGGGSSPYMRDNEWQFGSSRSQTAWYTFNQINKFNVIGNFRSYDFNIGIAFMLAHKNTITGEVDEYKRCMRNYRSKVQAMYNLGFNVIPQTRKSTGFEIIKEKFEHFEETFRHPYRQIVSEYSSILVVKPEIVEILSQYSNMTFSNTMVNTIVNSEVDNGKNLN